MREPDRVFSRDKAQRASDDEMRMASENFSVWNAEEVTSTTLHCHWSLVATGMATSVLCIVEARVYIPGLSALCYLRNATRGSPQFSAESRRPVCSVSVRIALLAREGFTASKSSLHLTVTIPIPTSVGRRRIVKVVVGRDA